MVNKNDTSDLKNFLLGSLAAVGFAAGIIFVCLMLIDKNYGRDIHILEAKVSNYIEEQWQAGETRLRPATNNSFLKTF